MKLTKTLYKIKENAVLSRGRGMKAIAPRPVKVYLYYGTKFDTRAFLRQRAYSTGNLSARNPFLTLTFNCLQRCAAAVYPQVGWEGQFVLCLTELFQLSGALDQRGMNSWRTNCR